MKPTLFAGIVTAICFSLPAQAQDAPSKEVKQKITVRTNGERTGKIKIVRNVNGKEEVIEREFQGEMPEDLKKELDKISPETIKEIHINKDGANRTALNEIRITNKDGVKLTELDKINPENLKEIRINADGTNKQSIVIMHSDKDLNLSFKADDLKNEDFSHVYELSDGKKVTIHISKIHIIKKETDAKEPEQKAEALEEPKIDDLTVYPNPSDGAFKLKFNLEQKGDTQVLLFDKEGNKLYEENLKGFVGEYEKPLELKGQKAGTYILKILQNGKLYTRQVILK